MSARKLLFLTHKFLLQIYHFGLIRLYPIFTLALLRDKQIYAIENRNACMSSSVSFHKRYKITTYFRIIFRKSI